MPGTFIVKASQKPFIAGESRTPALDALPSGFTQRRLQLKYAYDDLKPVVGAPYRVEFADGTVRQGTLDARGEATVDNPPGPGRVHFGYDAREAFEPSPRPANPIRGFRPTSPEHARQALQQYAQAERAYLDDHYFPDEVAALYAGEADYDDLLADYEYAEEAHAPERADDTSPGQHAEVLLPEGPVLPEVGA